MVRWGGAPTPIVLLARHSRLGQPARPVALDAARALVRCARSTGLPEPVGCGAPGLRPPLRHREPGGSLPVDDGLRPVGGCLAAPPGSSSGRPLGAAERLTAAAGRLAPCRARPLWARCTPPAGRDVRPCCRLSCVVAWSATLADAVHRRSAKPTGRRFTRSLRAAASRPALPR